MSKSITKNVSYTRYTTLCATSKGKRPSNIEAQKTDNKNACLAGCARSAPKCSAVEYVSNGAKGKKCFHINTGMGGNKASKGFADGKKSNAECYVRG